MLLDYNPARSLFILRVDRRKDELQPDVLMKQYGLDFSLPASTLKEAVLSTPQPYAAAAFAEFATPPALEAMGWIVGEIAASRAPSSDRHFDVPRRLLDEGTDLWPYQKADLEYMLRRQHSLDADEPGLGKTPTSITFCNEVQAQRVLVVCPASIRFQWLRKIMEWSTMGETYEVPNSLVYAITSARNGVHPNAAWTVISYDLVRNPAILAALRQSRYDVLILDEAHFLKTAATKRARAVFGGGLDPLYHEALCSLAKRIVCLTGTPLPNRPREAYVIARNLDHSSIGWMSEEAFGDRFNPIEYKDVTKRVPVELPGGHVQWREVAVRVPDEQSGRHAELQSRLRAHFMCRHLKREVLTDLKYPVFDLVRMEETAPVKAALRAERLLDIDPENLTGADATILGHISEARRIMGEAMAPQVAQYVSMCLEGGSEKIAVFYWHISVGQVLEDYLGRYGVCRIDGSTSPVVKDALVQRFRTDPSYRVIMGNMLSLGTGTDGLQDVCWHGVIAEPDWVPGTNIQCFDRLDRGGQRMLVQGDICVAPGSIAEKVLASALRKLKTTHASLDRRVA